MAMVASQGREWLVTGLVFSSLVMLVATAAGAAVAAPQSIGNTYTAAYHYVECGADYVVQPKSTQDVADAVKYYRQLAAEKGAQLKIRASRKAFHSSTPFTCPNQKVTMVDGPQGNPSVMTVAILHDKMNTTLAHDPTKHTMTIGAGMKIRELTTEATRLNMSVFIGTLPAYAGLTISGVMSTSGHGSGDNATSNICDVLISVKWVNAEGGIMTSPRDSPEAKLFCGGLGIIGIITEIKLQMTPTTHTKLITRYLSSDADLFNDIAKMLKVSPHILVFWRPDMKLYSAYILKGVSADVPASDAYMTLLPSYEGKLSLSDTFKGIQQDLWSTKYPFTGATQSVFCPFMARNSVFKTWASKPDGSDVLHTVGTTNNLVAAECWDECAWNSEVYDGTAEDVHLAIEWDRFEEWIQDLKNIFKYDLWQEPYSEGQCLGPGYMWLRFGHGSPDYLAMSYDMKRPVYVQSTWLKYKSVMKQYPMRWGWVQDLLEEMTLCKYDGRPHWGKNFQRTFTSPRCPIPKRYPESFDRAIEIQQQHDPQHTFEPELFKKIRTNSPYQLTPRCAGFEKSCYCEEDIHCAENYACVNAKTPGLESYKLCKPDWSKDPRLSKDLTWPKYYPDKEQKPEKP